MARRTARHERDAGRARPVDLEKSGRRQVVGEDDGFLRQRRRGLVDSGERAAHAVTEIDEIGRARPEGVVFSGGIVGNLSVERRRHARTAGAPASISANAEPDNSSSSSSASWNSRIWADFALLRSCKRRQIGAGSRDRLFQRDTLRLRRAETASRRGRGRVRDSRERPGGKARSRGSAAQAKRLSRHRENPARRGRQARRPPPVRRRPPHGNEARHLAAPWPP